MITTRAPDGANNCIEVGLSSLKGIIRCCFSLVRGKVERTRSLISTMINLDWFVRIYLRSNWCFRICHQSWMSLPISFMDLQHKIVIYEIYIWFVEDRFTINNFVTGMLLSNVYYEHLGRKSFCQYADPNWLRFWTLTEVADVWHIFMCARNWTVIGQLLELAEVKVKS